MALRHPENVKKISMNLSIEEHQKLFILSKIVKRSSMNYYLTTLINETYDNIVGKPVSDFNLVPHHGGGYVEVKK